MGQRRYKLIQMISVPGFSAQAVSTFGVRWLLAVGPALHVVGC